MKKSIIAFFILAVLTAFTKEENEKGELVIKVEGIKKVDGAIGILLFNQAEGFPELADKAIINTKRSVTSKEMEINLGELPFGKYAIAIVHDVNENKAFDKNFLGIPKEPFGFSNNKSIFLGLPDFEEASILIDSAQKEATIELINLY